MLHVERIISVRHAFLCEAGNLLLPEQNKTLIIGKACLLNQGE